MEVKRITTVCAYSRQYIIIQKGDKFAGIDTAWLDSNGRMKQSVSALDMKVSDSLPATIQFCKREAYCMYLQEVCGWEKLPALCESAHCWDAFETLREGCSNIGVASRTYKQVTDGKGRSRWQDVHCRIYTKKLNDLEDRMYSGEATDAELDNIAIEWTHWFGKVGERHLTATTAEDGYHILIVMDSEEGGENNEH